MTSRFGLAIEGSLSRYVQADAKAVAKIHTMTMRAAGGRTKRGIAAQIEQAFTDARGAKGGVQFARAIKLRSDPPTGFSATTSVRVWSKARYQAKGRRAAAIDLLEVYTRAETVKAANRTWLAIPTENAPLRSGRGAGGVPATPRESGLKLVFLQTKDPNKAVLVQRASGAGARGRQLVMYVLVRQTYRTARLTPDAIHEKSAARVAADFARYWAKEDAKLKAEFGRGLDVGQD